MKKGPNNSLTDVAGLEVGHYTDLANGTGCTVVLAREGAVGGVDVRGSAPGTRETDVLRAENSVTSVQGVVLSGGSAYGLSTADGVMRYLEERGIGHRVRDIVVPIVPAAILFDLGMVTSSVRPGSDEGYQAATQASAGAIEQGSVGAGTGTIVGKALGREHGMKGGVGTASIDLGDGVIVAALVAVNAIGGVVDPTTGDALAGPRDEQDNIKDSFEVYADPRYGQKAASAEPLGNTTIGVIATSIVLTKAQANRLASMAHDGIALAVRPAHMLHDGDAMFAMATGTVQAPDEFPRVCAVAPTAVSQAIINAVKFAESLGGIPSWKEHHGK
jgi:L-aminopeptidase/D-esterase-like protein